MKIFKVQQIRKVGAHTSRVTVMELPECCDRTLEKVQSMVREMEAKNPAKTLVVEVYENHRA